MGKGLKGFLIGLVVLAVLFCVMVLIWGDVKNISFVEVIQSWFPKTTPTTDTSTVQTTAHLLLM